VGEIVGFAVGSENVGLWVGVMVGDIVGLSVGDIVGLLLGFFVGVTVGVLVVGDWVGKEIVGGLDLVGNLVGLKVGLGDNRRWSTVTNCKEITEAAPNPSTSRKSFKSARSLIHVFTASP